MLQRDLEEHRPKRVSAFPAWKAVTQRSLPSEYRRAADMCSPTASRDSCARALTLHLKSQGSAHETLDSRVRRASMIAPRARAWKSAPPRFIRRMCLTHCTVGIWSLDTASSGPDIYITNFHACMCQLASAPPIKLRQAQSAVYAHTIRCQALAKLGQGYHAAGHTSDTELVSEKGLLCTCSGASGKSSLDAQSCVTQSIASVSEPALPKSAWFLASQTEIWVGIVLDKVCDL